jgi:hypothetical protein
LNDRVKDRVLPDYYNRLIGPVASSIPKADEHLARLMPTPEDLEEVKRICAADRDRLNALLAQSGQPPIEVSELARETTSGVDSDRLLAALANLAITQSVKLDQLRRQVRALLKHHGESPEARPGPASKK